MGHAASHWKASMLVQGHLFGFCLSSLEKTLSMKETIWSALAIPARSRLILILILGVNN